MKNLIFLSFLSLVISCTSGSVLDKEFTYEAYERIDYKKLYTAPELASSDLFLINYAIIRQRDYFNYDLQGKTYREILELAKSFQKNGLPVTFKMKNNGQQDKITQEVSDETAVGLIRKTGNNKRLLKTMNFECKYKNSTENELVILNSSFIVNGPFGDYLTTVNYEINCILEPAKSVDIAFVVPGKVIQKNLLYEGNPFIQRLGIDSILTQVNVIPSGLSIQENGKYFKDCFFNAARIDPVNSISFAENLNEKDWKAKNPDGTYELNVGNMHIPLAKDEVIEIRR